MPTIQRHDTQVRMSKAVIHGDTIYLCGQTAGGSDATDISAQTQVALERVENLLNELNSSKSHILSALLHIKSMDDFAAMNAVWDAWLPAGGAPARSTVQGELASPELLFEVTVGDARAW